MFDIVSEWTVIDLSLLNDAGSMCSSVCVSICLCCPLNYVASYYLCQEVVRSGIC